MEIKEIIKKSLPTSFNQIDTKLLQALMTAVELNIADPSPIGNGETAAVSLECPKTAALCYDRIWDPSDHTPIGIRFGNTTEAEVTWAVRSVMLRCWKELIDHPDLQTPGIRKLCNQIVSELIIGDLSLIKPGLRVDEIPKFASSFGPSEIKNMLDRLLPRHISELVYHEHGIYPIPIYSSDESKNNVYKAGEYDVIVLTLSSLRIVDEEHLSWEQVLQFRSDDDSRMKYMRFIHWLESAMDGKHRDFLERELLIRLDDYEAALKKHGVETKLGFFETLLDPKTFAIGGGAATLLATLGFPLIGTAMFSLTVGGNLALRLVRNKLDATQDMHSNRGEIAWVYQLKEGG